MHKTPQKIQTFFSKWLERSILKYVDVMDSRQNGHLHEMVIGGVEKPLLELVLKRTGGNQSQAANMLGINRNTLRKKLREYKIECK